MRTLFRDLWLADGSGAPLRRSAVLAGDGKILAVEPDLPRSAAERTVELGGRILAPGFIDVHGHSDLALPARPEGFGKISQGITTEIMGNCGLSAFPLTGRNREHLQELWAQYGVKLDWSDFRGWHAALSARAPKLRAEALAGHNTLRAAVAGYETETLTSAQLEEMKTLLDAELAAGAAGLSSGLLYVPGKFAPPGEIVELMRVAARRDRLYATHLRSEGNELLEALGETIDCAREAGLRRLHISHFKTAGAANWEKLDAALELLEEAQKGGIAVTVDRYPYTESMTQLSVILPGKAGDLDDSALSRLLRSTEEREKLALELAASRPAAYWKTVTLVSTRGSAGRNHARADHRGARGTRRQDACRIRGRTAGGGRRRTTAGLPRHVAGEYAADSRSAVLHDGQRRKCASGRRFDRALSPARLRQRSAVPAAPARRRLSDRSGGAADDRARGRNLSTRGPGAGSGPGSAPISRHSTRTKWTEPPIFRIRTRRRTESSSP